MIMATDTSSADARGFGTKVCDPVNKLSTILLVILYEVLSGNV